MAANEQLLFAIDPDQEVKKKETWNNQQIRWFHSLVFALIEDINGVFLFLQILFHVEDLLTWRILPCEFFGANKPG